MTASDRPILVVISEADLRKEEARDLHAETNKTPDLGAFNVLTHSLETSRYLIRKITGFDTVGERISQRFPYYLNIIPANKMSLLKQHLDVIAVKDSSEANRIFMVEGKFIIGSSFTHPSIPRAKGSRPGLGLAS